MSNDTTTEQAEAEAARLRSKNGVPKADLATIDAQARKIWDSARKGEVAPVIIARALTGKDDSKASGGTWATRIGALRLYNVVEKGTGNTFRLSELGIALSNTTDEEGHARALKQAVLGVPAYANLLARFDGGSLPEVGIIASEYEYGYELSKADAAAAAKLFIDSSKYAGLVNDEGHVNLAGVTVPTVEPRPDEATAATGSAAEDTTAPTFPSAPTVRSATPVNTEPVPTNQNAIPAATALPAPAGGAPVALNVKLDMSGWPVDDVIRVLAALGYEANNGPE